jgi:hypothetical protein
MILRVVLRESQPTKPDIFLSIGYRTNSKDQEFVQLLRVVHEGKGMPLHFEIPTEDGWNHPSIALKPDHYMGSLKIVPLNGRAKAKRFVVKWNAQTGASVDFLW